MDRRGKYKGGIYQPPPEKVSLGLQRSRREKRLPGVQIHPRLTVLLGTARNELSAAIAFCKRIIFLVKDCSNCALRIKPVPESTSPASKDARFVLEVLWSAKHKLLWK